MGYDTLHLGNETLYRDQFTGEISDGSGNKRGCIPVNPFTGMGYGTIDGVKTEIQGECIYQNGANPLIGRTGTRKIGA